MEKCRTIEEDWICSEICIWLEAVWGMTLLEHNFSSLYGVVAELIIDVSGSRHPLMPLDWGMMKLLGYIVGVPQCIFFFLTKSLGYVHLPILLSFSFCLMPCWFCVRKIFGIKINL